jgi:acetyl-CoA carboxylase biotin carboxylase subunit
MKKVLVANRGEIAVRIIRACRQLGIETVAVYSDVDRDSLHVQLADEAFCIGSKDLKDSYLNMNNILVAVGLSQADAVHPGFGFLSENPEFARLCEQVGVKFIGPSAAVIEKMGDKSVARETMIAAGVPVVPGSDGLIETATEGKEIAKTLGYPVLVKAAAGGGGRGMRVIQSEEEFELHFQAARQEADLAFGDGRMYLEKLIVNPRHIEVQIIADQHGNVRHLGTRDCSLQRRNQKVMEEAPATFLPEEVRAEISAAAVKAASVVDYENAGTIEFVVSNDYSFYFIEMNTRIQVEHPITEMVTGIDLIQAQLLVAQGESFDIEQEKIEIQGHSIECRLNAEDPAHQFRPSPGKITSLRVPGGFGVRMDSAVYAGYEVLPYYDSMVGKLIVHAETRALAIAKMLQALSELEIEGLKTNQAFHLEILNHPDFLEQRIHTKWLETDWK